MRDDDSCGHLYISQSENKNKLHIKHVNCAKDFIDILLFVFQLKY